ncbi:hypothetical protein JCM19000A_41980 [Silvimonas sp. JCM 19000]
MPATLNYPGVYIQELGSGVATITGVATSIAAFAGSAPLGPVNKAVDLFSFADYERTFGGLDPDSEMSYAIRQFFQNGGTEAFAIRVVKSATQATTALSNGTIDVLQVNAVDAGSAGNGVLVTVDYGTAIPASSFNLSIVRTADNAVETFNNLSLNSADARYALDLVNGVSQIVQLSRSVPAATLTALPAGTTRSGTLADPPVGLNATHKEFQVSVNGKAPVTVDLTLPADGASLAALATAITTHVKAAAAGRNEYALFEASATGGVLTLKSGVAGELSSVRVLPGISNNATGILKLGSENGGADVDAAAGIRPTAAARYLAGGGEVPYAAADLYGAFIGDRALRTGIYALESVDLFNLLCLPGVTDTGVLNDAVAYVQERRAFLIIDAPPSAVKPADMVSIMSGTALPKSSYAAVYYPWIYIADPLKNGKLRLSAPCGTVAGLFARTDADRGVWKAPAGTEASLVGVQALSYALTDREQGTLNPLGCNALRTFPVFGAVSWGARTLRGADQMTDDYKYVPVRRLALFLEESLYRGTQWVVFEPNDEPLWAQIRLNLGAFMNTLFRQGAFQGKTPRDAYLVKCDSSTTTQNDINRGVVNILVAFAPLKPAEFVVISIQQLAGQLQV